MPTTPPAFSTLTGIYEPSGIQQLPDGRFVVIEDEQARPFSLVSIQANGWVSSTSLGSNKARRESKVNKLDDLEGLTQDLQGNLYAITSHSRTEKGNKKKSRNKLVRFRINENEIVDARIVKGLKRALKTAHPILASAAKVHAVKEDEGLNIEALAFTPDYQRLLIGFRSPLIEGRAIIAPIENHVAMFEDNAAPQVADSLITLDLQGHGIRGMAYFSDFKAYLIISGPATRDTSLFQLWLWHGDPDQQPVRLVVDGLVGLERAEGVCPAQIEGLSRIVIVSDDGDFAFEVRTMCGINLWNVFCGS